MFEYTITGKFNLNTPFVEDFSKVQKELISQTEDCIHFKTTYPNGFVMETKTFSDKVILKSNHELIDEGNGNFSVKL